MVCLLEWLDKIFRCVSILGIVFFAGAIIIHYVIFGPKHPELAKDNRDIRRFSLAEKLIHILTLVSFLTLGITPPKIGPGPP